MVEKKAGVYQIVCKNTGKFYIGSSKVNIFCRWQRHRWELNRNSHFNKKLQNAWNKYGEESFEFLILEETTPDMALSRERVLISEMDTTDRKRGFNLSTSSGYVEGPRKEAIRRKIAAKIKAYYKNMSEEERENRLRAMRAAGAKRAGKHHWSLSDESKRRHSESMKGKKWPEESKSRRSKEMKEAFANMKEEEKKEFMKKTLWKGK